MVPAKDFKRRMVVEIDGAPHMIEQIQVQTPSARGAATLYKIKARNLKTATGSRRRYRGTDALNESSFERRPVQFLYRDPDGFHFMDSADFNQFSLPVDDLGDQSPYMTENMEGVEALVVDDEVIAHRDARHRRAADRRDRPRRPGQLGHRPDQAGHARRPATSSRSPSTSSRGSPSASTPGPASTSAGRPDDRAWNTSSRGRRGVSPSSRTRFRSIPQKNPPTSPSRRTTRWQGTSRATGFRPHAAPTARAARGEPI